MAVAVSTITTDIWDTIRGILVGDSGVSTITSKIHGAYPSIFINKEGGLPFVVVHKPTITEERFTLKKKKYSVLTRIDCVADSAATSKQLHDAVRNALESNEDTTRFGGNNLFWMMIENDDETFELRSTKRIHYASMIVRYDYYGGGAN